METYFLKETVSHIGIFIPLLKKLIYPEKKFQEDIVLHIGNVYPIEFIMNTTIPVCRIWLNVINLSQFLDVIIAGINIQYLSINHAGGRIAILTNKDKMIREVVHKKSVGDIFLEFDLSEKHIELVNRIDQFHNLEADLQVELFVESDIYKIKTSKRFTDLPCKLSLSQYLVKKK